MKLGKLLYGGFLVIAGALVIAFGGASLINSLRKSQLLELCPNQVEIAIKREFTCIVPVKIDIADGNVAKVYWEAK